jgi:hypothetical protein
MPLSVPVGLTLSQVETVMEFSQAITLVCLYYIRRDELWRQQDYLSYEDYAHRRWGVGRRMTDRWAAAGEIILDLVPDLDGMDPSVPCSLEVAAKLGTAITERRLRPLVHLKREGYTSEDINEVYWAAVERNTEPPEKLVREETIKRKKQSLEGRCSPVGAAALLELLALDVYDVVRHRTESDEYAVRCRDAVMREMYEIAADDAELTEEEEDAKHLALL